MLAGLTDPRVTYWEPAKWVARLRALKTDDNLLALRTNMDAGHGGAAGRFDGLKEMAMSYAFAIKVAGGKRSRDDALTPASQIRLQFVDRRELDPALGSSASIEPSMNSV